MKLFIEGSTTTLKELIKVNNPIDTDGLTKEEIKAVKTLKKNQSIYLGFIKVTKI